MGTDIGVRAFGGREAVEQMARRRGIEAETMLREERTRMRLLFGRGALYHADIMGDVLPKCGNDPLLRGRDITRKEVV